jgi:transcriptional regulator with XRE-family HTH domain
MYLCKQASINYAKGTQERWREICWHCTAVDPFWVILSLSRTNIRSKPIMSAARSKATAKKTAATFKPAKANSAKSDPAKPRRKQPAAVAAPVPRDELQIGGRLKHARLLAGILMRELAVKVGCTESMISKIESGRVVPSLPMLQRLVAALERDLSSFFGSDPNSPGIVLRAGERPMAHTDPIRKGDKVSYERLVPFGAGNLLEGNIHVIAPKGAKDDPITHQGETLGYVLEGKLELSIEGTSYLLGSGDSFFFKNHLTNRYSNPGPSTTRVLWVNTPQVH